MKIDSRFHFIVAHNLLILRKHTRNIQCSIITEKINKLEDLYFDDHLSETLFYAIPPIQESLTRYTSLFNVDVLTELLNACRTIQLANKHITGEDALITFIAQQVTNAMDKEERENFPQKIKVPVDMIDDVEIMKGGCYQIHCYNGQNYTLENGYLYQNGKDL